MMPKGAIVDATLTAAPQSTKNNDRASKIPRYTTQERQLLALRRQFSAAFLAKLLSRQGLRVRVVRRRLANADIAKGVLANSLTLSLYDGEELFNFAGLVEGHIVFGSFSKADKIKNADTVRLVVSKQGEAAYVHSLLKLEDQLLLLPLMVFSGDRAFFRICMKFAWRCCLLIWTFFIMCLYFSLDQKFYGSGKVVFVAMLVFVIPLFCFPFEYRTYKSMRTMVFMDRRFLRLMICPALMI